MTGSSYTLTLCKVVTNSFQLLLCCSTGQSPNGASCHFCCHCQEARPCPGASFNLLGQVWYFMPTCHETQTHILGKLDDHKSPFVLRRELSIWNWSLTKSPVTSRLWGCGMSGCGPFLGWAGTGAHSWVFAVLWYRGAGSCVLAWRTLSHLLWMDSLPRVPPRGGSNLSPRTPGGLWESWQQATTPVLSPQHGPQGRVQTGSCPQGQGSPPVPTRAAFTTHRIRL